MSQSIIVNCPNCEKSVIWCENNPFRPFCSRYCKLIDFWEWESGEKYILDQDPTYNEDKEMSDKPIDF